MIFEFDSISLIQLAKKADPPIIFQEGRELTAYIKAGRTDVLDSIIDGPTLEFLQAHIRRDAILVPVPRSAPLLPKAVWPAHLLCEKLIQDGFGSEIQTLLRRIRAVQTGHLHTAAVERATVEQHYDTINTTKLPLTAPVRIVLVDDVITQGRTAVACYRRLNDAFPHAQISIFTPVITRSFDKETLLLNPQIRKVRYFETGRAMVV
jgi:hypothetical protein